MAVVPVSDANAEVLLTVRTKLLGASEDITPVSACSWSLILSPGKLVEGAAGSACATTRTFWPLPIVVAPKGGKAPEMLLLSTENCAVDIGTLKVVPVAGALAGVVATAL